MSEPASPRCDFRFISQTSQLMFAYRADLPTLLKARLKGSKHEHLNVNFQLSADARTVLQSPTGSTAVEVHGDRAIIKTIYFDDYGNPDAQDLRATYAREKLGALAAWLDDFGAEWQFGSTSGVARWRTDEHGDIVRDALLKAFPSLTTWAPASQMFDLSVRVAEVTDEHYFSNTTLAWFIDRQFQLALSQLPMAGASPMPIQDWQLPVTGEGLEFRYDRNNKAGLWVGKTEWTSAELVAMCSDAVLRAPATLERLVTPIDAALQEAQ